MTLTSAGGVTMGGVVSTTVIVNDSLAGLPAASWAKQVTRLSPREKVLPDPGVQLTGTDPSTSSVAVGSV